MIAAAPTHASLPQFFEQAMLRSLVQYLESKIKGYNETKSALHPKDSYRKEKLVWLDRRIAQQRHRVQALLAGIDKLNMR